MGAGDAILRETYTGAFYCGEGRCKLLVESCMINFLTLSSFATPRLFFKPEELRI